MTATKTSYPGSTLVLSGSTPEEVVRHNAALTVACHFKKDRVAIGEVLDALGLRTE